ncbi:ferritin-like domain-containing protein [Pseudomonas sp. AA-38]|uniref:ferritin-like domain-containing protein n=1 Tax=Pseudomonas sp. AA-38 TaxID=3028807 RepID=UPI0023F76235|nr:ferritin-like domain-containing protein [Pseudomonas sp. AA-38]
MQNATKMGLNHTGAQMSPIDTKAMLKASQEVLPDVPGDARKLALVRSEEVASADAIGSVPLPGSAKGMVKSALNKLVGVSPEMLIDKLGERLAFERTGVRLYDALLAKVSVIEVVDEAQLQTLQRFRAEEAEHFELVKAAMEKLGADPTAMTPCADVAGVTAMGLVKTISDPRTNLAQSLNALLTAELTDNAGWELLIELADTCGQPEIAKSFYKALNQEQVHLQSIRQWLKDEIVRQV